MPLASNIGCRTFRDFKEKMPVSIKCEYRINVLLGV